MTFGDRLRTIRKSKELTQEQLANMIGVAKSTITGYEKDKREPNLLTINKLITALNVTGEELLGLEPCNTPMYIRDADEISLLKGYRRLNTHGKDYIKTTMSIAVNAFKDEEIFTYKAVARNKKGEDENAIKLTKDELTLLNKAIEESKDADNSDIY